VSSREKLAPSEGDYHLKEKKLQRNPILARVYPDLAKKGWEGGKVRGVGKKREIRRRGD